jgi:hypothetical protein
MVWLRDALAARGKPARLAYDDKVGGDVLLLSLDSGERDRLVEVTVARRPKGRAHLTAMATTAAGAGAAREALGRMHGDVSRLANAKRKFIHRIERVLEQLVAGWDSRAAAQTPERAAAFTTLQGQFAEAVPMTGVGFHVDVAGADDHHTKEVYPTVHGAAVLLDGRWRGVPWDAETRRWMMRAGTMTAVKRARPTANLDGAGIGLVDAAVIGAAGAAAIVAGAAVADIHQDVTTKSKERSCDWGDVFDPCDVLDCAFSAGDLGNCIPDCDGIDCGAIDCSL